MWYLNIALTAVMVVGLGVCVYALAIGVVDLIAKVRADRLERSVQHYQLLKDERECYADIFENIVWECEEQEFYNVDEIMAALRSYVDGVRSSRTVKKS